MGRPYYGRYRFNVLYFTRCGVKSLPNFSTIIAS